MSTHYIVSVSDIDGYQVQFITIDIDGNSTKNGGSVSK